jgi:transposase-like protein
MPRTRKNHPSLKAKVVVEAIKGVKTTAQIAHAFGAHPNLVANWKKQALEQLKEIFSNGHKPPANDTDKDELYKQIGQLRVELDFLKGRAGLLE